MKLQKKILEGIERIPELNNFYVTKDGQILKITIVSPTKKDSHSNSLRYDLRDSGKRVRINSGNRVKRLYDEITASRNYKNAYNIKQELKILELSKNEINNFMALTRYNNRNTEFYFIGQKINNGFNTLFVYTDFSFLEFYNLFMQISVKKK